MPRKTRKTQKPALLFQEPSLGGARLQNGPEVRAALNPKSFITERQIHNSTTLTTNTTSTTNSWVSPQFEQTHLAASPVRRGRRRCESATSILNGCSQLSRKTSVCKFPSLSFERRTRDRAHQPKHTGGKRAAESAFVSGSGNQQQVNGTVSHPSVQRLDTPKRQCTAIRKRNRKDTGSSECTASSSKCLDQLEASYPSNHAAGRHTIPTLSASTPPSASLRTPNANSVFTPPDVDTPEVPPEVGSCPSPHFLKLLLPLSQSSTPPDILVADTPERDYGVKVTWRRRRGLMMLLKERGHLSNSDGPIHS